LSYLKGQCFVIFGPLLLVYFFFFWQKRETEDRRGNREERDNVWEIYLRGQWHDHLAPNCCTYFGPSAESSPTRIISFNFYLMLCIA
jgi:hypothetical protein